MYTSFRVISLILAALISSLSLLGAENLPRNARNSRSQIKIRKERFKNILEMGKTDPRNARRNLEDILENDKEGSSRAASAVALGKIRSRKSIPKLKNRLQDPDIHVRMRAAWALGRMRDKSGKRIALETLKGDDVGGQLLAAEALGSIGDKTVIPELKENLKHKKVTVRWHSKVAIKKVEMSDMNEYEKVEYLGKILSSNQMNNWASVQLAKMGTNEAIDMLITVSEEPGNPGAFAAQKALARLKELRKLP